MAELKMQYGLTMKWVIEGFEPMTTDEFCDLLKKIDRAQCIAELAQLVGSQKEEADNAR